MNKQIEKKTEGIITISDYNSPRVKVVYWVMVAFLVICSIVALVPIVWAFLSGFKELDEFYSINPTVFPKSISFSKITEILEELKIVRAFGNSMIQFACGWFGNIIVGGIAGYTISRLKPRGSRLLFKLMLWTMMMPHTLSMVPMFMTWTDFPIIHINFQNTWIPFLIGSFCSIFNILLFKNYFDSIPNSYIESAKLDGCTNIGIFTRIIMPLSKPIISTITVFVFTSAWNDFMGPFLYLKKGSMSTVALKLYNVSQSWTEPNQLLAAFIVLIPTIIVFMFCSKQIMGNNMNVGVKE